jgi:hypothetical protein
MDPAHPAGPTGIGEVTVPGTPSTRSRRPSFVDAMMTA